MYGFLTTSAVQINILLMIVKFCILTYFGDERVLASVCRWSICVTNPSLGHDGAPSSSVALSEPYLTIFNGKESSVTIEVNELTW